MATIQEQQLGQQRPPTGGTAVSLYSPGASETGIVKSITVTNTSGASATYRIFVDDNGTTFDQTTAVAYDVTLGGGEFHVLSIYWPLDDATGAVGVECDTNNAITFTAFGAVITA